MTENVIPAQALIRMHISIHIAQFIVIAAKAAI
jgi:hypothetical protein